MLLLISTVINQNFNSTCEKTTKTDVSIQLFIKDNKEIRDF